MMNPTGDNVEMLFTLKTIFDKKANASGADVSNHVNLQVPKGGQYSIFYTSCDANALVTFRVRTELYNLKDGGVKDYLPVRACGGAVLTRSCAHIQLLAQK